MKTLIISVALLCSLAVCAMADADSSVISPGELISKHVSSLKPYGDGKPLNATPAGTPGKTEVMMWRVGDGILTVTVTIGAGVIRDMSYITRTDGGKGLPLKVKEFNPETGDMTIMVPNNRVEATK